MVRNCGEKYTMLCACTKKVKPPPLLFYYDTFLFYYTLLFYYDTFILHIIILILQCTVYNICLFTDGSGSKLSRRAQIESIYMRKSEKETKNKTNTNKKMSVTIDLTEEKESTSLAPTCWPVSEFYKTRGKSGSTEEGCIVNPLLPCFIDPSHRGISINVKDLGASEFGSGTQVSTTESDAYALLIRVLQTAAAGESGAKLIDLGSGRGMLCAVAAELSRKYTDNALKVYGIEHSEQACEYSRSLLHGLGLNADIYMKDLYFMDALPFDDDDDDDDDEKKRKKHIYPVCQSHGMAPSLQWKNWALLLPLRQRIKVVVIGIGNVVQEAPFYSFFYSEKGVLRSNVYPFYATGPTQLIHVIDTSSKEFWDDLEEYMENAMASVDGKKITPATKAYLKFMGIKEQGCPPVTNGKRKRKKTRHINITPDEQKSPGGTFT